MEAKSQSTITEMKSNKKTEVPSKFFHRLFQSVASIAVNYSMETCFSGRTMLMLIKGSCDTLLKSKAPLVAGAITLEESQRGDLWTKLADSLEEKLRAALNQSLDEPDQVVQKIIREDMSTSTRASTKLKSVPADEGSSLAGIISQRFKGEEDIPEEIAEYEECFGDITLEDFNRLVKNDRHGLMEFSSPQDVRIVKKFSLSAGLFDRFSGTGEVSLANYQLAGKRKRLCGRVANSTVQPKTSVTPRLLQECIRLVHLAQESEEERPLSKRAVKKKDTFEITEKRLFYRSGLNGRPDVLQKDSKGNIISVIEFKGFGRIPRQGDLTYLQLQPALYMNLVQAPKGYLFVHPTKKAKFSAFLVPVSDERIKTANARLLTLKSNFKKFTMLAE